MHNKRKVYLVLPLSLMYLEISIGANLLPRELLILEFVNIFSKALHRCSVQLNEACSFCFLF